jgi:hypothetical protein
MGATHGHDDVGASPGLIQQLARGLLEQAPEGGADDVRGAGGEGAEGAREGRAQRGVARGTIGRRQPRECVQQRPRGLCAEQGEQGCVRGGEGGDHDGGLDGEGVVCGGGLRGAGGCGVDGIDEGGDEGGVVCVFGLCLGVADD